MYFLMPIVGLLIICATMSDKDARRVARERLKPYGRIMWLCLAAFWALVLWWR